MSARKVISLTSSLILRIVAAAIMLKTMHLDFTGDSESVYIFTRIGMEPWGRFGVGLVELAASILLLVPRTVAFGALLSICLMLGAVAAHLFVLGIQVRDDGGQLFVFALVVLLSGSILLLIHPVFKRSAHAAS